MMNRKSHIYSMVLFLVILSCKSPKMKMQDDVLNVLNEKVFYDFKINERIKEYGIVYKEFSDYEYFINYDYSKIINYPEFKSNVNDSLLKLLFSKKEQLHYKSQFLGTKFSLKDFDFKKGETKVFDENVYVKEKNRNHYKITISKPVFFSDESHAIVFSTTGHLVYMYVFKKNKRNWNLLFHHII